MRSAIPKPALLAAFWFGIQAIWGALLGISLQDRTKDLHPHQALIAYGVLAAVGALTAVVVQLRMGPFSDRLRVRGRDRRLFFVIGALCGAVGIFAFYFAPSFGLLVGALVFLQIGMNVAIGPYQAIIPDYFAPSEVGMASAWMAVLQSLGNAAGALCVVGLSGSPLVLACALAGFLLATCAVTVLHSARLEPREIALAKFKIERAGIDLFVSRAILWTSFYTVLGYLFFYAQDTLHVADAKTVSGIVTLLFTVFGAAGAALSAKPADRFDRRLIVNASTAVFIVSVFAFIFVHDVRLLYVVAACAGIGWGGFLAADWALGCAILPAGMMATAMGIWNIAVAGPQIVAPLVTTTIVVAFHPAKASAPLFAFSLAALEALLGTLWIWRLPASVGKDT